jgi:hypothetical protein
MANKATVRTKQRVHRFGLESRDSGSLREAIAVSESKSHDHALQIERTLSQLWVNKSDGANLSTSREAFGYGTGSAVATIVTTDRVEERAR